MRTIFNRTPADWRELEEMVAQIFKEMGFDTQRGQTIETVRNNVAVDVVAIDAAATPAVKIFVECKQWNKNIPQEVVHAFRTVVQDSGAHLGIIVAASGFQQGAIDAVQKSNILLFSWPEFQEHFYDRWFETMLKYIGEYVDPIVEFYDYFGPITRGLGEGTNGRSLEENVKIAESIQAKWAYFHPASKYLNSGLHRQLQFPLDFKEHEGLGLRFQTPREYFDLILAKRDEALAEFEAFTRGEA